MRTTAVWKGAISFGLVNIYIELYTAIKAHSLGFNLLHAKCHTPINYRRWCPHCDKEVSWDEIVKGMKLENGTYFIITKETLEKLRPEKTDFINIVEFIDVNALQPIYFDQHYYIAPAKETDKAFFLFLAALKELDKIAIGQFVLRDKQYVCSIQPYENALLLTTLNYEYEIKHVKKVEELKVPKIEKAELRLAQQLIDKLSSKKFDMSKFKDTFAAQLQKRIKEASKSKLKKVKESKKPQKREKGVSLIEVLQASLKKSKHPVQPIARAKSR